MMTIPIHCLTNSYSTKFAGGWKHVKKFEPFWPVKSVPCNYSFLKNVRMTINFISYNDDFANMCVGQQLSYKSFAGGWKHASHRRSTSSPSSGFSGPVIRDELSSLPFIIQSTMSLSNNYLTLYINEMI